MPSKLTQESVEKNALKHNLELKSTYAGAHYLHDYKCLVCFYEFPTRPGDVKCGHGCPRCAGTVRTQTDCELDAANKNLVFLSNYSGRALDKHNYRCLLCLFKFPMRPNNVKSGQGCPKCGDGRKGQDQVKTQVECELDAFKVKLELTIPYSGRNDVKHDYKCLICLYEFPTTPNSVQQGHGCPRCGNVRSGLKRRVFKNDNCKRIANHLRTIFRKAIKNALKDKKCSAVRDLGCTIEEFVVYFENLFQPGMTWENHSKYGWHIDHIKPLARFDLESEEEQRKAVHYTNLQPLWAYDNHVKGAKYEAPKK